MLTSFAGARLFGESYGTGVPRVLALHGWRRDHHDFDPLFRATDLAGVALDLPGFASTPAPDSAWGTPEYADAVAALSDELADQVIVVGHSFGGRVAVHLAARHPELIGGIVLTGAPLYRPPGRSRRPAARFRTARWLERRGLMSGEKMEALRHRYGSEDYRAASGVMRDVLVKLVGEEYDEALDAIACPVELVWGDDDTEAPLSTAEWLHSRLEGSRLTICPGAGHLTPLTVPGELAAAISRLT